MAKIPTKILTARAALNCNFDAFTVSGILSVKSWGKDKEATYSNTMALNVDETLSEAADYINALRYQVKLGRYGGRVEVL